MPDVEDEETREALKQALWFSVGKIVDEQTIARRINATPQFIGALAEMVFTQVENVAKDLETFSRHAGRTTITTDDVLLLARRNEDLHDMIKDFIDNQKAEKAERAAAAGKSAKGRATGRGGRK
ncbi:hypothetical protein MKZ38_002696 [Zalerion maritima]|uniref:Centromere protein S n=1 Tax=Zalerion maritima TaxID=339359 RepID=A0AAD5WR29_9PEZI|nr:hypothetical protein MKZ38_002696 [Zalerion maritima]